MDDTFMDDATPFEVTDEGVAILEPAVLVGQHDDKTIAIMHWPMRGQPDVIERALSAPPALFTQLVWKALPIPDRLVGVEPGACREEAVVLEDMTQVFPEATLLWLSAWQNLINTGAVWHADGEIGRIATKLLEDGFCMLGPQPVPGYYGDTERSRHQVLPGKPGSARYVSAMMGEEYVTWLSTVPA